MSEDSDTPVFVYNTKDYVKDREEWIPADDEEEEQNMSIKNKKKSLKRKTRNDLINEAGRLRHVAKCRNEEIKRLKKELQREKIINKELQNQLQDAQDLAPVLIDE